jgi:hypothetical protein
MDGGVMPPRWSSHLVMPASPGMRSVAARLAAVARGCKSPVFNSFSSNGSSRVIESVEEKTPLSLVSVSRSKGSVRQIVAVFSLFLQRRH